MNQTDTQNLLERYVRNQDEEAFGEIVANYIGLVQATALRRVNNDSARAHDITQIVFTDLARQASRLSSSTLLGSWLYKHTCFVASKFIRSEQRRTLREKEAAPMLTNGPNDDVWAEVAPLLDSAMLELSAGDQNTIVLRFFERQDLRAIAAVFNISEDAAQKRVQRALERLRGVLQSKGVSISVPALSALLLGPGTLSATAASATAVAATALAGAAAPAGFLTMVTALIMSKATIVFTSLSLAVLVTFLALHKPSLEPGPALPDLSQTSVKAQSPPGIPNPLPMASARTPLDEILRSLDTRLASVNEEEITQALYDFWSQYDAATPQDKVQLRRAIPAIIALWPNASINLKKTIISTLGRFDPSTEQMVDLYLDAYKTEALRNDALNGISWAGASAAKATDLLVDHLRRNFNIHKIGFPGNMDVTASLIALSKIGPPAANAVPMLKEFLAGTNTIHRDAVLRAYWNITHDVETVLPALTNALIQDRSFTAADILGKMGEAAVPALSALQEAYASSPNPSAQLSAYEAIREIDRTQTPTADRIIEIMNTGTRADKVHAAQILWDDFKNPDQILPTVTELITMRDYGNPISETKQALDLITEIGPPAAKTLPEIKSILENPIGDSRVWIAATNAWRALAPDTPVPSKRSR